MKEKELKYIIIPENILLCKKLPANAKLLYGEILSLCDKKGYCWASNNHFAKRFGVSITSISLWMTSLRENGFIKCQIKENKRKVFLKAYLSNLKTAFEKEPLRKLKDIYKGQGSLRSPAREKDDFKVETKEWVDDKGHKHGQDSIDYES